MVIWKNNWFISDKCNMLQHVWNLWTLTWSVVDDEYCLLPCYVLGRTELMELIVIATILDKFPLTEETTGTEAISIWKRHKHNGDTWKHYEIQYELKSF